MVNLVCFKDVYFDIFYDCMQVLFDGFECEVFFKEVKCIVVVYMFYKVYVYCIVIDIEQFWMSGFYWLLFWQDFWQFVDIDLSWQFV